MADTLSIWHTTPRWRAAHLLVEATTVDGAAITLCGRQSRPDDAWSDHPQVDESDRCGQCDRRLVRGMAAVKSAGRARPPVSDKLRPPSNHDYRCGRAAAVAVLYRVVAELRSDGATGSSDWRDA